MDAPARLELLNAAEALARGGRYGEALPLCDHLLALRAEDAPALDLKGSCLRGLGKLSEALSCFKLARLYLPAHAPIRFHLGRALEESGEPVAALAEYDETLRLDGENWPARVSRGKLRAARGDDAGALADFEELVRRAPESGQALLLRGGCHLAAKRYPQARADLEEAGRRRPSLKAEADLLLARIP